MRSLTVARAFGALLAAVALAAPLRSQERTEPDPIEVSAKKLESSLERAEAAAKKLAATRASKRQDVGATSAAAKGAKESSEASDRAKKDAERIQRIEQQLEDQKNANARSLLDLQTQLADVKASLEARAALAEKERDAAREDTAALIRAQRDLLEAVRAQRAAVQELVRAAEAALRTENAPSAPREDVPAQPRRRSRAATPRVDS